MPCLEDVACISATLATDATHVENGDTSFPLILLLPGFGFTVEVSVLSSISATLATDATHVEDGHACLSLTPIPNLSLLYKELPLQTTSVLGSISYSCFECSVIDSIRVAAAPTSL